MQSNNWIVQNLQNALNVWNEKLAEVWRILAQSPAEFQDGAIWRVMVRINGALQAVGFSLLVLFFLIGMVRTCGSLTETRRPEQVLRLFLRFILAKTAVTYGMELMNGMFLFIQGIISTVLHNSGVAAGDPLTVPDEMVTAIESVGFFESIPLWAVALIGSLVITVLSFILILGVYGRFFRLYLYTALAPIPLASFAGEPSSGIGKSFLKGYAAVCLEGAVILLGCVIYSIFAASPPVLDAGAAPVSMAWTYTGQLIFGMLVLVGTVKMTDQVVREMMGLH